MNSIRVRQVKTLGYLGKYSLLLIASALSACSVFQSGDAVETTDPDAGAKNEILAWFETNEVAPFPETAAVASDAAECSGVNEAVAVAPIVLWPEPLLTALRETGAKPWALVEFDVSLAGLPENVRTTVSSAPPVFEETALASVRGWRFAPAPSGKRAGGCVVAFR
jgi:TonB family protein